MLSEAMDQSGERERALGEGMRDVATELRLIDVVDLVTFIRLEQLGNVEALVNSAAELYFKPGTVVFGASAEVNVDWGRAPTVLLDMEFKNTGVKVYFSLILESQAAAVEINYISFDQPGGDPANNTRALASAVNEARLLPIVPLVPFAAAELAQPLM